MQLIMFKYLTNLNEFESCFLIDQVKNGKDNIGCGLKVTNHDYGNQVVKAEYGRNAEEEVGAQFPGHC